MTRELQKRLKCIKRKAKKAKRYIRRIYRRCTHAKAPITLVSCNHHNVVMKTVRSIMILFIVSTMLMCGIPAILSQRKEAPPQKTSGQKITDSWAEIEQNIQNGRYLYKYDIGDTKEVNIGSKTVTMQIVAFDTDVLPDNGTAAITWMSLDAFRDSYFMNHLPGNSEGWEATDLRELLKTIILPQMPMELQNMITPVMKKTIQSNISGIGRVSQETCEAVWIPSCYELFGASVEYEVGGPCYADFFANQENLKKSSEAMWWLRSAGRDATDEFCCINPSGQIEQTPSTELRGIVIGFCTGKTPTKE